MDAVLDTHSHATTVTTGGRSADLIVINIAQRLRSGHGHPPTRDATC